jgi:hypothetical protein
MMVSTHVQPSTTLSYRFLVLSTHFIIFEAATTEWYLYMRLFVPLTPPLAEKGIATNSSHIRVLRRSRTFYVKIPSLRGRLIYLHRRA